MRPISPQSIRSVPLDATVDPIGNANSFSPEAYRERLVAILRAERNDPTAPADQLLDGVPGNLLFLAGTEGSAAAFRALKPTPDQLKLEYSTKFPTANEVAVVRRDFADFKDNKSKKKRYLEWKAKTIVVAKRYEAQYNHMLATNFRDVAYRKNLTTTREPYSSHIPEWTLKKMGKIDADEADRHGRDETTTELTEGNTIFLPTDKSPPAPTEDFSRILRSVRKDDLPDHIKARVYRGQSPQELKQSPLLFHFLMLSDADRYLTLQRAAQRIDQDTSPPRAVPDDLNVPAGVRKPWKVEINKFVDTNNDELFLMSDGQVGKKGESEEKGDIGTRLDGAKDEDLDTDEEKSEGEGSDLGDDAVVHSSSEEDDDNDEGAEAMDADDGEGED